MDESDNTSGNSDRPPKPKARRTTAILANTALVLSILPLLSLALPLLMNIVISLRNGLPFPHDPMYTSVIATVLVAIVGFVFGYSLVVNIMMSFFALPALVLGTITQIRIKRKGKNAPSYKRLWVAIMVSAVILLFAIFSRINAEWILHKCRDAGITFPSGTRLHFLQPELHFVGSECGCFIRVTMAKKDLSTFLQHEPISAKLPQGPLVANNFRSGSITSRDWPVAKTFGWDPDSSKNRWGTEWENSSSGVVVVDLDHPEKATVFLFVWYWPLL